MSHGLVDKRCALDSPIRRMKPTMKLWLVAGILVGVAWAPRPWWMWALGVPAVALATVAILSRISWAFLLRRLLLLGPFVAGVALLALFQPNGVAAAAFLVSKSLICLLTMILLTQTTSFTEILAVLRTVRLPGLLITVVALMYRYTFVLVDEAERLGRARRCRTFSQRRWPTWTALATVAGQLFVRSSERADRVYAAMCARGWR